MSAWQIILAAVITALLTWPVPAETHSDIGRYHWMRVSHNVEDMRTK